MAISPAVPKLPVPRAEARTTGMPATNQLPPVFGSDNMCWIEGFTCDGFSCNALFFCAQEKPSFLILDGFVKFWKTLQTRESVYTIMRRPWDSLAYFSHPAQPPRRSRIVAGGKEERKKRRSCGASPLGMSGRGFWFSVSIVLSLWFLIPKFFNLVNKNSSTWWIKTLQLGEFCEKVCIYQGRFFDSVYHLSCPRDSCLNTDYTDWTDGERDKVKN